MEFVLAPVQHWSSRALGDRHRTLWGGGPCSRRTATGSSAATPATAGTSSTPRRFESGSSRKGGGFDIALIAVGAYEPRWFMRASSQPRRGVQIHKDLGAKRRSACTGALSTSRTNRWTSRREKLAELRAARGVWRRTSFFVLAIGETRKLATRAVAMKET